MTKKKISVVFGGMSAEHEVSILSASQVLENVNRDKFLPKAVYVTKDGEWFKANLSDVRGINSMGDKKMKRLVEGGFAYGKVDFSKLRKELGFAFLLTHGSFGEDGRIQGLLESFGVPYLGSGVFASAICMDKIAAKEALAANGISVVPYIKGIKGKVSYEDAERFEELPYPLFIKPANAGSSVGISKVHDRKELQPAFRKAAKFDDRILIEQGIDARELEIGVLSDAKAKKLQLSAIGEILPEHEYYDYESKYQSSKTRLDIPAKVDERTANEIREIAAKAFTVLGCRNLARVDFLQDKNTGEIFFNEINTLPGFTQVSMYPLLFKEAGISYPRLIEKLSQGA
jgi:D-alanine-D-alanine ligase